MKWICLWFSAITLLFSACKKSETAQPQAPNTTFILHIRYNVDGAPLRFDTIAYKNAAGNPYSVTRLQYYLSGFQFYRYIGANYFSDAVFYRDARNNDTLIVIKGMPAAYYGSMQFYIGLDSTHNRTNALENTAQNINMAWPDVMGGGYHFLKLEGDYLDTLSVRKGFTMHIGTNAMCGYCRPLAIYCDFQKNDTVQVAISMNVNDWFGAHYIYDFNVDGNYTMGNPELMQLLLSNGEDVFKVQP